MGITFIIIIHDKTGPKINTPVRPVPAPQGENNGDQRPTKRTTDINRKP